jgi:hypothetical protein
MTAAAPSTALATIQPSFTDPERLALAGYLAGYRGLTREAYGVDLRQFTASCRSRSLALFAVRRADIEGFARELEARGRVRATVTPPGCARLLHRLAATAARRRLAPQSVTDRDFNLSVKRRSVLEQPVRSVRGAQNGVFCEDPRPMLRYATVR